MILNIHIMKCLYEKIFIMDLYMKNYHYNYYILYYKI